MKLVQVLIKNYKSIEEQTFIIEEKDGSHTFSLIGINESGKSNFLNAISLIDDGNVIFSKDFYDAKKNIEISLTYTLDMNEEKELKNTLSQKGIDKEIISKIEVQKVEVCVNFDPGVTPTKRTFDRIYFKNKILSDYTLNETIPVKKDKSLDSTQEDLDLEKFFEKILPKYFYKISHRITFWKSDSKHLINDQINLETFSANPEEVSIPLLNCFALAGIEDIASEINNIRTNPAEINNLQEKLSDKVTSHIRKVWIGHQVKIKFQIDNMTLSFLIEDEKVKYSSKTTDQRSDGFRQFISFLLTIAAESANNQLSNSLLLLDEPETHLHPQAQECLKDELIKITKNSENNIVIFATHSNYMIDKNRIDRCYRVFKQGNKKTEHRKIEGEISSYSEVNYEVFGISSSDYHNELYGYIEEIDRTKLDGLDKNKKWNNKKSNNIEDVSLATYIRHSIHHPENTSNSKFTEGELVESIESLRQIKQKLITETKSPTKDKKTSDIIQ